MRCRGRDKCVLCLESHPFISFLGKHYVELLDVHGYLSVLDFKAYC